MISAVGRNGWTGLAKVTPHRYQREESGLRLTASLQVTSLVMEGGWFD